MQQTNINGSIVHSSRNFDSAKEHPIIHQSIFRQYQALRDRTVSAVELCEQYLDYIRDVNPRIHAFIALDEKRAMEAAKVADTQLAAGIDLGILHGIPFAVKDLIFVEGFVTQCGSKQPKSPQPQADIIDALERAGAICLGKLATYEYATVGPAFDLPFEIVRNPVNPDHVTGGSSSGSAAAVASRMLRFAIGTDTGGSIRSPAAYCGVVGLKPTFGALSSNGIVPLAPTMDVPGIIAASALEAWIALSFMHEDARLDDSAVTQNRALPNPLKGKKIGYARNFFAHDPKLDPEILEAMDHAASVFSLLGADIIEIDLPDYQPLEDAAAVILHVEAYDYHALSLKAQPESYGNLAYNSLLYGNQFQQEDLLAANLVRESFKSELAKVFKDGNYDAILTVNTLTTAVEIAKCNNEKPVWSPMRTIPFNLTGNPVLAMPAGFTSQGLPIGLQLIGEAFTEDKLCQIGSAYETQAVGFWTADVAHGFGVV